MKARPPRNDLELALGRASLAKVRATARRPASPPDLWPCALLALLVLAGIWAAAMIWLWFRSH